MSSAKSRTSRRVVMVHCMPSRFACVVCPIIQSMDRHPWRTPVSISNSSESTLLWMLYRCISHSSSVWERYISQGCHSDETTSTTLPYQCCQRPSHNPQRSRTPESSTRETAPQRGYVHFAHSAPFLWNNLPCEIRQSPTLTVLKSNLKTYFFNLAFDPS